MVFRYFVKSGSLPTFTVNVVSMEVAPDGMAISLVSSSTSGIDKRSDALHTERNVKNINTYFIKWYFYEVIIYFKYDINI